MKYGSAGTSTSDVTYDIIYCIATAQVKKDQTYYLQSLNQQDVNGNISTNWGDEQS